MDLILIIIIIALPLIASAGVKNSYTKYKSIKAKNNLSGFEVARKILDKHGLQDVHIVKVAGTMTDHYDPKRKVVRLSTEVFDNDSISSNAIAAHEVGHAIQDKEKYTFMRIRSFIYPVVKISSNIGYYVILIGFLFELLDAVKIGILLTSLGLAFQIITLPVEFDASKRANKELESLGLLDSADKEGVQKVLKSAAFTYVAGTLASALQILRLVLAVNRRD